MKRLTLFFTAISIMTSCSMYGSQISKQHTSMQQEWKKFYDDSHRRPKFSAPEISQELPKPISYGIFIQSTYGNNATSNGIANNPYQAIANFKEAENMAQQSREIGAPLSVGTLYRMSHEEKKVTHQIHEASHKAAIEKLYSFQLK